MAQELLNYGDYNVIRVCWKRGAAALYSQAVANARVVGLEVGYLINWLADEYGLDRGTLHLIGHSLGAHISGYAGEQISGALFFYLTLRLDLQFRSNKEI